MTLSDLPEIQITRNIRSTRLRLRVESTQIRLTAPVFCSKSQIQKFLVESEAWMIKTWYAQQQKVQSIDRSLPNELVLFNLNTSLKMTYITQKQNFIFDEQNLQLFISDRQPEQYLKAFVIAYAKQHLPVYLSQVSQECNLPFVKCAIRQPKTRWGSCSAKHDLMLNSALVFFPKEIVRYVCVHELAHTQHFDHSARFWSLVAQHDVNFQQHQKFLKSNRMPWWW
jgi:hypothetical protein